MAGKSALATSLVDSSEKEEMVSFLGSGDHDMCVPFIGSEAWTLSLGYKILSEWRPWMSDGQVAGYLIPSLLPVSIKISTSVKILDSFKGCSSC